MQLDQLSDSELEIYSRQLLVKGWGLKQQLALKSSVIFLTVENEIAVRYLIAAGVGRIFLKSTDLLKSLLAQNPNVILESMSNYDKLPINCIEVTAVGQKSKFTSIEFESKGSYVLDGILVASAIINKITATIEH